MRKKTEKKIKDIIRKGYEKIAKVENEDAKKEFFKPCCEFLTDYVLLEKSKLNGIKIESVVCENTNISRSHKFILIEEGGERWVVDPTWQQFLNKPRYNKPRVLIAKTNNLDKELKRLEIPINLRYIWLNSI